MSERTALYRLYDAGGRLLYVGATKNTLQRWNQHKKTKPWWRQVARREVKWFDSRPSALLAEHWAIVTEFPLHNSPNDPQGLRPGGKTPRFMDGAAKIAAAMGVKGPTVDSIIATAADSADA